MNLFHRLFASALQPDPSSAQPAVQPHPDGANAVVTTFLSQAGWHAGRCISPDRAGQALAHAGFTLHDTARQFLSEFGGLAIDVPIDGAGGLTGFAHFAPEMVLRFLSAADRPFLSRLMPESACPVGTTSGHTVFVFLDDRGQSYLLDLERTLFTELAATPSEMVEVLCDGRNGRVDSVVLDDQGQPTRERITAADERRHWQLEAFPHVGIYLSPTSLSPGRRPPTWRPLVRSAEQVLSKGGLPASILVMCGGLTQGLAGQWYFVAHCENSVWVRQRAGFRVSAPPPGVAPGFRVGQIVPFTPPAR